MAEQGNMLSGFQDGSIWKDPNFQSLLAGLGGAIDQRNGKTGIGGQVGNMFQGYIQSVEAQKAMEKQMKEMSIWTELAAKALGTMGRDKKLAGQGMLPGQGQEPRAWSDDSKLRGDRWIGGM